MKYQLIAKDVKLGGGVKIYNFVNLYGCEIGDNTKIASFVEIRKGVKIGKNCKIEPFAFIPEGVTIEDNVFIGPCVCFVNDLYPRATTPEGKLQEEGIDWQVQTTLIRKGASIGANAVILCGVTIGEEAMIGAGSVVTRSVPAKAVAYGNPARVKGESHPTGIVRQ